MNLVIVASLANPPTESLYFRFLTLCANQNLKLNCLLEAEQELKDLYYSLLKSKGAFDYLNDIVTPAENEFGIRLDMELNYPLTIQTKSITGKNVTNLLGQIEYLNSMSRTTRY